MQRVNPVDTRSGLPEAVANSVPFKRCFVGPVAVLASGLITLSLFSANALPQTPVATAQATQSAGMAAASAGAAVAHPRKKGRRRRRRRKPATTANSAAKTTPPQTPAGNAPAAAVAKGITKPAAIGTRLAEAPSGASKARAGVARVPVSRSALMHHHSRVHIVQNPNPQTPQATPPGGVAIVNVPVMPAPEPQTPKWPAFDRPSNAIVTWDSRGLTVQATNSSLKQILRDVSSATGLKVEGLSADERVFGIYGPGLARDVLSDVLQGSGYNVLMIGDLGAGAPRRVLLSIRQAANHPAPNPQAQANSSGGDEDDAPADDQSDVEQAPEPAPEPVRPGFEHGGIPRTPQQIMQEMQQRQLQMQQEQEQEQQQQNQQQLEQQNQQPEQAPQPDQQ